jgi:hypothetical protein
VVGILIFIGIVVVLMVIGKIISIVTRPADRAFNNWVSRKFGRR